MIWKRTLFTLAAAAIGFGVLAFYWSVASRADDTESAMADSAAPAPISEPFVTFVDPMKGPKDAKALIIEFGDHSCPFCRSTQQSVDRLMEERPGQVRFVWKSAPSPLHPGAETAAEAALCAGRQGKFWEYHAQLFEGSTPFNQTSLAILADGMGLDIIQFNECLVQGETRPLVERTVTEARALGLTDIPTLFINGKRYDGALSYEQLLEAAGL